MQQIKKALVRALHHGDLLSATLLLGKIENPQYDPTKDADLILEMASAIWHRTGRKTQDPILQTDAINHVLFKEHQFQGRTEKYKVVMDDPKRFFLHHMIQSRVGNPLPLCLLYWILGEQIGLTFECLALPTHYLLRIRDTAGEFYIDPFDHGKRLTVEEFHRKFRSDVQRHRMGGSRLYERFDIHLSLARLVEQLKQVYTLKGEALAALRAVEFLSVFFPEAPEIRRDRGILYCEMEYFSKAQEQLQAYLRLRPQAEDIGEIRKLAQMLKGYREIVN